MRILLINRPYQTLTSNLGVGHQVPLGLLAVGGPLRDAGHDARLLDAECQHHGNRRIVAAARQFDPGLVMTGHASSAPAHLLYLDMPHAIKTACPRVLTAYGGSILPITPARSWSKNRPST
jgi:anaerobic magnesium-protoporphyrin IX monomethyl ester cyclase